MKNFFLLFGLFVLLAAPACKDEDTLSYSERLALDKATIDAHLAQKGIAADTTTSGLRYVITDLGDNNNVTPSLSSTVTVKYKGYFLDGEVFDQTEGAQLAQFAVSGVVSGFGEAVRLLNKKGKGTFYLPSGLAYGTYGSGSIPPNTPIVFDIELIDFF